MSFRLDERIERDSRLILRNRFVQVRLQNHATVPWLVLVPECAVTEVIDLAADQQSVVNATVNTVSHVLRRAFSPDKINTAAIGNVVPQLHIHVIGRYESDPYWPGVVWGHPLMPYADLARQVENWRVLLAPDFSD